MTTMQSGRAAETSGAAVALIATMIAIYLVSQFLRNSVGVIAPNLAQELGLTASDIGLLSSAFFLVFAAAQIPLGIALDRFGPRLCLLVCAVVAVVGALVFAMASSTTGLVFGRALLGLGCSAAFMAPLALYARRFPPERFATLVGLQLGLGSIGTLLATAPLAYATAEFGWRESFLGVGAFTLLAGALVAVVVRDDHGKEGVRQETLMEAVKGVFAVFRTPSVGRLFLVHITGYSTFALVVGLWGGPYLTHVYGYSLQERGQLLLVPALAQIIGALAWGPTDRLLGSYKRPVVAGMLATCATLAVLAGFGRFGTVALLVWLTLFGFLSAYIPVSIAHGKSLFPPHLVGRGMTLLNMGSMGGVFASQAITGVLIDLFPANAGVYPLEAYRLVFGFQAAMLLISCAIYLGSRDPRRDAVATPSGTR